MENNISYSKCAIIGCGFVGVSIAFSLMQSSVISKLILIDIDKTKATGEATDISHGMAFSHPQKIFAGDYKDISDCKIIIITAGVSQKPGQTRLDLVDANTNILEGIIENIKKFNNDCILLIVSNPVDILTYKAYKLSGFEKSRVIGSGTVLDTGRLRYLLGEHFGIDNRNIHAIIAGEHGDNEFPVWSGANISGLNLIDYCKSCGGCGNFDELNKIFLNVRDSAYEIIKAKGQTCYGIAMAVKAIVKSIIRDEKSVLTVSSVLCGEYGHSDIAMSVPSIIGKNGIESILEVRLADNEKNKLDFAAEQIKAVLA